MKKLSTILIVTGLIFLGSTQVSCSQTEQKMKSAQDIIDSIDWKASPPPVERATVTISVGCGANGEATLTNNGNAEVKDGTQVKWHITCPKIKGIQIAPGSKGFGALHSDIWEAEPVPFGAKSWMGQIKELGENDPGVIFGFYNLIWFDENNTPHVIDPLIKVNK